MFFNSIYIQRRKLLNFLLCFVFPFFTKAQIISNLINNYSAEQFTTCPTNGGQVYKSNYWYQPTFGGSSDYFNICATFSYVTIPSNVFGIQTPRTGNAYLGFLTYGGINFFGNQFKEYLGNGLKQTLKPTKVYCITYYLSLSDNSRVATANVGVYFSKDSINSTPHKARQIIC